MATITQWFGSVTILSHRTVAAYVPVFSIEKYPVYFVNEISHYQNAYHIDYY